MSDAKHVVLIHGSWSRGEQLSPARQAFEERGYTVHTPTLRHHELPFEDGAAKIATLSLRDYVGDLSTLVTSLESPPLLVGHSLGGLLAQLVAARTDHVGVVAACPSPVGSSGLNPTTIAIALPSARRTRPWARPFRPPTWKLFRDGIAHAQSEADARDVYAELVCESGRVTFFELAAPWLDKANSAAVDYSAMRGPVLVIGGEFDRIVRPSRARQSAARHTDATYVEVPRSDHFVLAGAALPVAMDHIDQWVDRNQLFD